MDIKENFYSKLQQIREDYDKAAAERVADMKRGAKSFKKEIKNDPINKSWYERNVKGFKDEAKKAQKKAVTGLDEEQLDELRGKGTVDKKEMQAHIRKKHDAAWTKTQRIRKEKKSAGPADTKDMDKYRNRLAKMHNKLDEVKDENFGKPMELGKVVRYAKNPDPKKMDKIGKKIADIKAKAKKK